VHVRREHLNDFVPYDIGFGHHELLGGKQALPVPLDSLSLRCARVKHVASIGT
jgi:hypothetical protein